MLKEYNNIDRAILYTAMACCIVFSYFLYDDSLLDFDKRRSDAQKVGVIETRTNDVRQKYAKQFMWRPSKSKSPIYQGDSIFTGSKSETKILLADGSEIIVKENSLVIFSNNQGDMGLDFKFGQVVANLSANSKVKLTDCGQNINLTGDHSQLQIDKDSGCKGLQVKVLEGQASLNGKKFNKSDVAEIKKNKNPSLVDLAKQRAALAAKSLKIPTPAPVILEPKNKYNHLLTYGEDGKLITRKSVPLKWSYGKKTARFEFELSPDPEFKTGVSKKYAAAPLSSTPDLAEGIYHLRVREYQDPKVRSNSPAAWSTPVEFTVSKKILTPNLEAPVLLTKEVSYNAPANTPPFFKWTPAKGAQKYVFEIAKDEAFTNKREIITSEPQLVWSKYGGGHFFFRVSGQSAYGFRGPASEIGNLNVRLNRPTLSQVPPRTVRGKTPEDQGDPQEFKVDWKGLPIADAYKIEVSEDDSFSAPLSFQSRSPASTLTVPKPGNYKWRVQPLASNGKPLTPFSEKGELQYILKVPLATPVLLEPGPNMTLFFQDSKEQIFWFEWKPVRQAETYQIEVATDKEFSKIAYTTETKTPRLLMKEKLPQGKLYWRIKAGGDGKSSDWSEVRRIKIFAGKTAEVHSRDSDD